MASDENEVVLYNVNDTENLTHEEIWDDSLLIQQYDEAMAQVRRKLQHKISATNTTESEQSERMVTGGENLSERKEKSGNIQKKKKKKKNKRKSDWHTGDPCRSRFTEDGIWYEGTIIALDANTGKCTVRYVGYNNEEEVAIHALIKSKGKAARQMQMELADDGQSEQSDMCSSVVESDFQSDADERTGKRQKAQSQFQYGRMPPPNYPSGGNFTPPPHLPQLPPPPALTMDLSGDPQTSEALHTMLMSWYMTGYHTGYYQGLRQTQSRRRCK
ncbi:survival motor neuron protein 1-like isoform X1 [Homarus americanus]|nr:survival motor neuron protein 1-like isoform X1 [Homarus americanus]XP_042230099.1 survival motor neuron protein 1-like isoform X1 [Homarus americanus]